jgi:DNA (cytosine-5)-methyltransferase 1
VDTYTENVISLYSGGGGLDIGIGLAVPNARTVCYVERDIASVSVLVKAMQTGLLDEAPIWTDSNTFDGKPWGGKVDWIIGGFPCQPWSVAGRREGTEDKRWLWDDIKRIISEVRPKGIFLENVPGLLTGHGIDPILGTLSELGYDTKWGNVKASDTGATHRRARIFILAYSRSFGWGRWRERNEEGFKLAVQAEGPFSKRGSKLDDTKHIGLNATEELGSNEETVRDNSQGKNNPSESKGTGDTRTTSQSLGDTISEGLEGFESESQEETESRLADGTWNMDVFPPGPDSGEWDRIREERPNLSPALEKSEAKSYVRRMVNGVDVGLDRVDRLRILGNGVVPLQAAYAFKLLMDKV